MATNPKSFYEEQLKKLGKELEVVQSKLSLSSLLRLVLFLLALALGYFSWREEPLLLIGLAMVLPIFVFLIVRHNKLRYEKKLLEAQRQWNTTELRVLKRDYLHLPTGEAFETGNHAFSKDLDLFGRGSFFQYLNRTALPSGSQMLSDLLLSNDIGNIPKKQEAVQELSQNPEWFQHFEAVATLVTAEVPAKNVVAWLNTYTPFVPKHIHTASFVYGGISLLAWALYLAGILSGYAVFGLFLLGLGVTGRYIKQIGKLSVQTSKVQATFRQYGKLLQLLEQKEFSSDLLKERQGQILNAGHTSSKAVHRFSKMLDALDQRNNIIIGLFTNGFMLRDLYVCKGIEAWIAKHKDEVAQWFGAIAFFDAYISMGNYTFNHQDHVFPRIGATNKTMVAKQCVHPLLAPETAVANDFGIANDEFFVITGANMAGKSTFLRTVGLQIVMANTGLPVRATAMDYSPIKLVTSMRTSDSLTDDESYFFSELKRLKYIIDTIKEMPHFIILDEILKGTNSKDKAAGSKKFLEKLVGLQASGIIATHDLSLCEVAKSMDKVKNHYFDAQIKDNELYFDYTFKEGICQNMNASFLLRKMGIV